MTLMPGLEHLGPRLELVEGRRVAVDLPVVVDAPMSSVSSGWPSTLKTWPSTALPTGTVMPRPVLRTGAPRTRPSVGCMQMQRTRPSPICWATSAVTVNFVAVELEVHLDGVVDLGQGVRRELDVDDRAGDGDDPAVLERARRRRWPAVRWWS